MLCHGLIPPHNAVACSRALIRALTLNPKPQLQCLAVINRVHCGRSGGNRTWWGAGDTCRFAHPLHHPPSPLSSPSPPPPLTQGLPLAPIIDRSLCVLSFVCCDLARLSHMYLVSRPWRRNLSVLNEGAMLALKEPGLWGSVCKCSRNARGTHIL